MRFKLLEPSDFSTLKPFFQRLPYSLCEYSLPSIVTWRDVDEFAVRFAIEDGTLLMTADNGADAEHNHMALPLPADRFEPERLHALTLELGFPRLDFVPEEYVAAHGIEALSRFFEVAENTDFEDYVYRTEDLAELQGRNYAKKRNLIHQFETEYLEQHRVRVEPITPANAEECLEFVDAWCLERDCEGEDKPLMACEKQATINGLEEFERLELSGILVRLDGAVSGIGVRAPLNEKMGVLHFEKAFMEHKGLYQYLDRECARRLFLGRDELINKESDMGLDGLRQTKRSYFPSSRVRCYKLVAS